MENLYFVERYADEILETARATARREALAARAARPRRWMVAFTGAIRARYPRWSSAASIGSKPTTARA